MRKNIHLRNMVFQFEDIFIMYCQYNLKTTESIMESLNGMLKRQSSLAHFMTGWTETDNILLEWCSGPSLYGFQLQL